MYKEWQITTDDLAAVALDPNGNEETALAIAEIEHTLLEEALGMIEERFYEETRQYTQPPARGKKKTKKGKKGKKGRKKRGEFADTSIMEFQLVFSDPQHEGKVHYITKGQVESIQMWYRQGNRNHIQRLRIGTQGTPITGRRFCRIEITRF